MTAAKQDARLHMYAPEGKGYIQAIAGNQEGTQEILKALLEISEKEYISPFYIAIIYIGLDNNQKAIDYLENALEIKEHRLLYLYTDPVLYSYGKFTLPPGPAIAPREGNSSRGYRGT